MEFWRRDADVAEVELWRRDDGVKTWKYGGMALESSGGAPLA